MIVDKGRTIFGIKYSGFSIEDTVEVVGASINNNSKILYADLNAQSVLMINEDEEIKSFFSFADLVNIDGQAVVWAERFISGNKIPRTTGCDLMFRLISFAHSNNVKCYFLGAKQDVLVQMLLKIKQNEGGDLIAGYHDGYFSEQEEKDIVNDINRSKANILFVGITSPKKEQFLLRNYKLLHTNFNMGVGGSFDVYAGLVKRAPLWMQRSGLEWLYRVVQEPKRMWKRYLIVNTRFILFFTKVYLKSFFKGGY